MAYLQKIGCKFLKIDNQGQTQLEIASSLFQREFYVPEDFKEKVFEMMRSKIEKEKETMTSGFIKSKFKPD